MGSAEGLKHGGRVGRGRVWMGEVGAGGVWRFVSFLSRNHFSAFICDDSSSNLLVASWFVCCSYW